ncbi:MAG TPA: alpha-2-macroglobulin family protein [Pyrinomonadaceae bacterium]|nr:alpha-2-macroglobulin family protein [Pyrinomonadaceae bacterium]
MRIQPALARLLLLSTLLTLVPQAPPRAAVVVRQEAEEEEETEGGLRFRLSSAAAPTPTPTGAAPNRVAAAEPLPESETQRLLARLPPPGGSAGDVQDFKLREGSLPAPRAGETIRAAFAPPEASAPPRPDTTRAPLEVLRFAPEGEVSLAPALSVTFSQPMVAVSSQAEAAASTPVRLSPQPAGRWRWLSAQTLVFQPDAEGGRLPAATSYTVTIPAGTKSALGNALAAAKTFTFATPPPKLVRTHPDGEGRPRDALMFMEFDQRVDAARVLSMLKAEPASLRLRAATEDEIAADEDVSRFVKEAQPGRWLALRATAANGATKDAMPADTTVRVVVPAGTPSAEGPRVTTEPQSLSFKTYGALRVSETDCGSEKRCSPFDDFLLSFTTLLDESAFKPEQVRVTPAIPGVKITASGNSLQIEGDKRSNTVYTVTLDRSVRDIYGQTLTGPDSFTFKVTTREPGLFSGGNEFAVLDPAARRVYSVYSINYRRLKISLYKVTPEDWPRYRAYQLQRYEGKADDDQKRPPRPPGVLVSEKVFETKAEPDKLVEVNIDLSPALSNGYGQAFVRAEPVEEADAPVRVYARRPDAAVESWVQATDIGLDAFVDKSQLVAWASSLKDGRPLAGVQLSVLPEQLSGATGADGLARFALKGDEKEGQAFIVARRGGDTAILPQQYSAWASGGGNWRRSDDVEQLRWYVFDDRRLYRPGEEVSVKGWVRKVALTPGGDTELFAAAGRTLTYVVKDSRDNKVSEGQLTLNALAGFDLKLKLPPTMNLGDARVEFIFAEGQQYNHNFMVQEFRRPEFEVTARASEAPHFVGSAATVAVSADYYAGGPLADAEVRWDVVAVPTNYTPPNRDDYTFGMFVPWWGGYEDGGESTQQSFEARTDSAGRHTLRIDFDSARPPRPSQVAVQAAVQDVNRQGSSASTTLLVHPSEVYVGLKAARTFVQKGEPFDLKLIVTDLDGRALEGREVRLRLARHEYVREEGEWKLKEQDVREQTARSGADGVGVRLPAGEGGQYSLTARVLDDRERPNETELKLWVAGGRVPPKGEGVEQETVQLIPGSKTYKGGDVAEVLVQSPFAPAEGVLTLRRSGLLRTERFRMEGNSHTLRVPVEEGWTPNVHLQVDLVGAAPRTDAEGKELTKLPPRPAYASGELNLDIPPAARRLSVTAAPRERVLEPGKETVVSVEVKDAQGRPVQGTDTAVVVVDESVLALTDYKLKDPLSVFYVPREADTSDYHLREIVELADPSLLGGIGNDIRLDGVIGGGGPGGGGGGLALSQGVNMGARMEVLARSVKEFPATEMVQVSASQMSTVESEALINLRQDFNALAVFAASLPTDAAGRAEVKVRLPDNLTRYRVTAVSVAGGRLAGSGESNITARLPLMARPSAPRFLNFGDRAELPVVLQNQTDREMTVGVAVRATNAELTGGQGRRVRVPANDRVEVRFPVAAGRPGTARFQVAASAGEAADAAEVSLPVYTPATTEAFATYGVIDEGAVAQPVKAPPGAVRSFGGLEVTTSSTQLQELTDAFIYLQNYPFECSEQIASRVLSVVALRDVLEAFKAKDLPPPAVLRASIEADLKRLEALQNDDGGFDFWRRGRPSVPYVSVHVAHALARARLKQVGVPEGMEERAREFLRQIRSKIPDTYSKEAKWAIEAYALYVRSLMEDRDAAGARRLVAAAGGVEKLSLESLGWLLPVLSGDAASAREVEAIRRHLDNRVTETAGAAHFADSYSDGEYTLLHSDRRADAVVLEAFIGDRPESDLIPKLVRGLLAHRTKGRWENTQENVFVLLALDRYFRTYEKATPDFVARVWLGDAFAGERVFKGRTAERQQLELPMSLLAERTAGGPSNLVIGKEGAGRLYFRVASRYAPADLKLSAADYGFRVERVYEGADDAADVRRDADGTWHVRAGARVRVRVSVLNPARRYHVALVDPMPAGLEALNPELATTGSLPAETGTHRVFMWAWYEHQNLRDERAEAFTSLLWEGEHEYSYFTRATTPGLFVVPPPRAEEMYSPETFGRGRTDRVVVE